MFVGAGSLADLGWRARNEATRSAAGLLVGGC